MALDRRSGKHGPFSAGYAVFAAVVLDAPELLGFVWGFLGTILWLAFLGFVFYLILRVFAPGTADKVARHDQG